MTYQDKAWDVLVRKQARYGYAYQTDFELRPLACKKITTFQIGLISVLSFTEQTHIILTHSIPARLSSNSYIWYPWQRRKRVLIKYSQNYDFYIFYFVPLEVGTAALKIFCLVIPSLVDTSLDFGLFRGVRPYSDIGCSIYSTAAECPILAWPKIIWYCFFLWWLFIFRVYIKISMVVWKCHLWAILIIQDGRHALKMPQ